MSTKRKLPAESVFPWLRSNLGKHALGCLTGTDTKALCAAVQILELYAYHPHAEILEAFRIVVLAMQPGSQRLAYHSVAHVLDWPDRAKVWEACGFSALIAPGVCSFEPGGSGLDLNQSEAKIAADRAERATRRMFA